MRLFLCAILALPAMAGDDAGEPLLTRLVRHDDFEDAATRPVPMPDHYHRFGGPEGAAARGFPRWGRIALTDEHAYTGNWSLGFSLEGGSLAARIPSGVVPVLPRSNYMVCVRVRTGGLTHAAARLVAWRYDAAGEMIAASRRESPPVRTDDAWETISVALDANVEGAVDLGVELQLVQPRQLGVDADPAVPLDEDFTGHAWFDDLTIWHLPRIELSLDEPTGVFSAGRTPSLHVAVHDLIERHPDAHLEVTDAEGVIVMQRRLEPGPARRVTLDDLPFGGYAATVRIRCDRDVEAVARRSFVVLPSGGEANPVAGFGVAVGSDHRRHADIVRRIGAGIVLLDPPARGEATPTTLLDALDRLESEAGRPLLVAAAIDPHDGAGRVLLEYGELVDLWQLGAAAVDAATTPEHATPDALRRALPRARVIVPWPAERAPATLGEGTTPHLVIGAATAPASIELLDPAWSGATLTTLELPGGDAYRPADRVTDLVLRTLHAWRAGLPRLVIRAPWSDEGDEPDATLVAWHQLGRTLSGRRPRGEITLGPGIRTWVIGDAAGDTTLIAWAPRAGRGPVTVTTHLGAHPVTVVDAYGNRRRIEPRDGLHTLELTEQPLLIEGIDTPIALFRAAFALDPPRVSAEHRRHEHRVRLVNPWPVPITGTMQLAPADATVEMTPRASRFQVKPGEQIDLPVTIIPSRGATAGPLAIEAQFEIDAPSPRHFTALATLEIGLDGLRLQSRWRLEGGSLIVMLEVTNTGDTPRDLEAFLHAPGLDRRRRAIGRLEPGASSLRRFTLPDLDAVRGATVYVGVDEPSRGARLMEPIVLP